MKNDSFPDCSASKSPKDCSVRLEQNTASLFVQHIIIHLYERDFLMTAQI